MIRVIYASVFFLTQSNYSGYNFFFRLDYKIFELD